MERQPQFAALFFIQVWKRGLIHYDETKRQPDRVLMFKEGHICLSARGHFEILTKDSQSAIIQARTRVTLTAEALYMNVQSSSTEMWEEAPALEARMLTYRGAPGNWHSREPLDPNKVISDESTSQSICPHRISRHMLAGTSGIHSREKSCPDVVGMCQFKKDLERSWLYWELPELWGKEAYK